VQKPARLTAFAQLRVASTSPLPELSFLHRGRLAHSRILPTRCTPFAPRALHLHRRRRRRRPRRRSRLATTRLFPRLSLRFPFTAPRRSLARTRRRRRLVTLPTRPWACIVYATVHDARVPTVRAMHAPRLTSLTSTSSLSPVLQPVSGLVIGPGLVHATTKSIASSFRPGLVHAH
jgi:hypothetical protein